MAAKRKAGRPPAGKDGQSVARDYLPALCRFPPDVAHAMRAAAAVKGISLSALLEEAWITWFRAQSRSTRAKVRSEEGHGTKARHGKGRRAAAAVGAAATGGQAGRGAQRGNAAGAYVRGGVGRRIGKP